MRWITKDRFFMICDESDTYESEFLELQELAAQFGYLLTKDNWQIIYKIYEARLKLHLAEKGANEHLLSS